MDKEKIISNIVESYRSTFADSNIKVEELANVLSDALISIKRDSVSDDQYIRLINTFLDYIKYINSTPPSDASIGTIIRLTKGNGPGNYFYSKNYLKDSVTGIISNIRKFTKTSLFDQSKHCRLDAQKTALLKVMITGMFDKFGYKSASGEMIDGINGVGFGEIQVCLLTKAKKSATSGDTTVNGHKIEIKADGGGLNCNLDVIRWADKIKRILPAIADRINGDSWDKFNASFKSVISSANVKSRQQLLTVWAMSMSPKSEYTSDIKTSIQTIMSLPGFDIMSINDNTINRLGLAICLYLSNKIHNDKYLLQFMHRGGNAPCKALLISCDDLVIAYETITHLHKNQLITIGAPTGTAGERIKGFKIKSLNF